MAIDLTGEIVTIEQLLSTYNDNATAGRVAERNIEFLKNQKVLPLTLENPRMLLLNHLGLRVYYAGTLVNNDQKFSADFTQVRPQHIKAWKDYLDLGLTPERRRSTIYWIFGENGAVYARLLSCMGFHTSVDHNAKNHNTKAAVGSALPAYLSDIIDQFPTLDKSSKETVRPYIVDCLEVLFETKTTMEGTTQVSVFLKSQPSQAELHREANQVLKAINIIYPEIGLTEKDLRYYEKDSAGRKIYFATLEISPEKNLRADPRTRWPFQMKIEQRPSRFTQDHYKSRLRKI